MAQKPADTAAATLSRPSNPPVSPILMITLWVNLIAAMGTLGFTYYFKVLFKKPKITESEERQRLTKLPSVTPTELAPTWVEFEPITVNIMSTPQHPQAADGTQRQLKGKLHYATVGFSVEVRDRNQLDLMDTLRPLILDDLITILGRKQFHELTTVQGRYILHSQILEAANQRAVQAFSLSNKENWISNLYFTHFLVQ